MRVTKADKEIKRMRQEADQRKREAECQASSHIWRNEYNHIRYCERCYALEDWNWLPPGTIVVHRNDPLWIGTVLFVTREGVRVHRKITDAWGTVTGTIEATFQPNELRIIEETQPHA